jgi:hypothetical protein
MVSIVYPDAQNHSQCALYALLLVTKFGNAKQLAVSSMYRMPIPFPSADWPSDFYPIVYSTLSEPFNTTLPKRALRESLGITLGLPREVPASRRPLQKSTILNGDLLHEIGRHGAVQSSLTTASQSMFALQRKIKPMNFGMVSMHHQRKRIHTSR